MILVIIITIIVLYSKNVYSSVSVDADVFKELNTSMSYINIKIRQNDIQDVVSVKTIDYNNENALCISGENSDIWIYDFDGKLFEETVEKGEEPKNENVIEISEVTSFDISQEGNLINYSVSIKNGVKETSSVCLRTGN